MHPLLHTFSLFNSPVIILAYFQGDKKSIPQKGCSLNHLERGYCPRVYLVYAMFFFAGGILISV